MKMGLVKKAIGYLFLVSVIFLAPYLGSADVFGEGWIGGGAPAPSVDGGWSGGGGCDGDAGYYDLTCTGYSWIYYKYIGGEKGKGRDVYFRRDGFLDDFGLGAVNNLISGQCSLNGEYGGFWHLGYNAKGSYYGPGIYVMLDSNGVRGLDSIDHVYSVGGSKWGHALTFQYGTIPDYYKGNEIVYDNDSLGHTIYKKIGDNYVAMYKAEKFGNSSTSGDVLRDYKAAYRYVNGKEYPEQSLPDNVYAFCYWDGMADDSAFQGTSRVLKDNVPWEDSLEDDGRGVQLEKVDGYGYWRPTSDGESNYGAGSLVLENCPADGCSVVFRHYMRRKQGSGESKYTISRFTNEIGVSSNVEVIVGWTDTSGLENSGKEIRQDIVKVKPGQRVCEQLKFYSKNSPKEETTTVVCAVDRNENKLAGVTRVLETDNTGVDWGIWKNDVGNWWIATNNDEWASVDRGRGVKVSGDLVNCGSDGCDLQFRHYLKNPKGKGSTAYYKIVRSVDGVDSTINESTKVFESDKGTGLQSDVVKIYLGQTVCETLYFKENESDSYNTYTKACVTALGSVSSNIKMKVRNGSIKDRNSDSEYQYFNDNTYAKPGDEIEFQATYDAVPQYLENLKVDTIKINGENNTIGGNGALKDKFNAVFFPSWNKGFVAFDQEYTGSDVDSPQTKSETAQDNTVREITKMAETNPLNDDKTALNESVWTTPSEVTFMREGDNLVAEVSPDGKSDSATLKIPYNFENAIRFDADSMESKPFYAGEKADIDIIPTVNSTFNEYTSAEYATRVDSPQIQVCLSYDELNRYSIECNTKNYDSWNSDGNGGDVVLGGDGLVSFNIPDNPAGTKIYVHARVYPVNSGSGDNTKISGYGGWSDWIHTEKLIAKKPSFQVWGGNTYVGNKTTVPVAIKNNLSTGNEEGRGSYIFGSWTELALAAKPESGDSGIVSGSNVNMIGSGASLGYAELRGPDSTLIPSRNPENGLGNNVAGMSPGGGSSIDKVNLLRFSAGGFSIPSIESVKVMMGYNGDLKSDLPEGNVEVSETTFYHNEGDISISYNISVNRGIPHGSLSEVPKVVVYAENNINIECSVTRIDAILIAKGAINTCSDINGEGLKSSSGASNQLIINGALYAKTINFNRTYGAATGNNSIVPAEIINYDNSLLISGATSRTSEGELNVEATFELAPRF